MACSLHFKDLFGFADEIVFFSCLKMPHFQQRERFVLVNQRLNENITNKQERKEFINSPSRFSQFSPLNNWKKGR